MANFYNKNELNLIHTVVTTASLGSNLLALPRHYLRMKSHSYGGLGLNYSQFFFGSPHKFSGALTVNDAFMALISPRLLSNCTR